MEKIIYMESPNQIGIKECDNCGNWIEGGDECYYHGDGIYTCSLECAKEFEGN